MTYKITHMDNAKPWKTLSDIPLDALNNVWFYHISELNSEWCTASKIVGINKDTVYIACRNEILSVPFAEFVSFYLYNNDPNKAEVYHCGNP